MIETIISSSVLILIITLLRYLFRGKVSSQLQYALWALVALRLLLPFTLFESPVSVMNAVPDVQRYPAAVQPVPPVTSVNTTLPSETFPDLQNSPALYDGSAGTTNTVDEKVIARFVWLSGLMLSGVFFTASNILLSRKIKQNRRQIDAPQCPLPVYMVDGLPSPCLYGIVKPVLYVTPESLSDENRTRHVIAHELTHYRQKDHIWAFIRVLCLCVHWFNPLVWMAAVLSRRDSELACDEGTLRRIGPENRIEYGRTLIEMMTVPSKPSGLFCCATTMTDGKREMTERIKRIAKQPKTLIITLVIVPIIAVAATALTFGGAAKNPVALPDSSEVTGISIEQISVGKSLGAIQISQKADVETVLNALENTDKVLSESFNDAPDKGDYIQIDINGSAARRFYLYNNEETYYLEEPYVGVYRTDRQTIDTIAKVYSANGNTSLSVNVQALWKAKTPYVGDNSAVGKLLGLLPLPGGLLHDYFALRTTDDERGIEWVLKKEDNVSYGVQQLGQNALFLFALVDNLEDFYVTIDNPPDDGAAFHYTRSWANEIVGSDVREYAQSPDKLQELLGSPVSETPSYRIAKLENGEVVSEYPFDNAELADAAIMDIMVKSAAWDGTDITVLDDCYLIRQTFPSVNETHDYYAYLLKDGRAVMQSGMKGRYSILSQELYSELVVTWDTLAEDTWLVNTYTESVPRPDFDNMLWMTPDDENGYCVACYQDVSSEKIERYLQTLADDGWQTIRDLYEHTTLGSLYQKDNHTISLQFDGNQLVMYFSLQ